MNTIASYYMQVTLLPKSTLRELDMICNNFLWGQNDGKQKIHLVGQHHTFLPKEKGGLGIRSHQDLNIALMAKLGWRLTEGTTNLAKECIESKYVRGKNMVAFKKGSQIWKNVAHGSSLLEDSRVWKVGNGHSIDLWRDNWLGIGPIVNLVQGPLNKHEEGLRVKDIIRHNTWDINALSMHLPHFLRERIKNTLIHFHVRDKCFSMFVDKGKFSLTCAYKALVEHRTPQIRKDWIWKSNTLPKLRFFMWLVWWDRLPHKALLSLRKIIAAPTCSWCQNIEEDSLHAIRDCSHANEV